MNFHKMFVVVAVVALIIILLNQKSIPVISTMKLSQSTNNLSSFAIEEQKQILQISSYNLVNLKLEHKLSSCQSHHSIFTNGINLLGRLIIVSGFSYVGKTSNSVFIERYVKLIFNDILPIFLVIFFSLSLLIIASIIAAIAFSPASLSTSLNYQSGCVFR